MAAEDFMVHRVDVYLQASLTDETGGLVRDPRAAVKVNVPCLVRPRGGTSETNQDRASQRAQFQVYFATDLNLTRLHLLFWKDGRGDEHWLWVQSDTNYNGMDELVAVDCVEAVL